MLGETIPVTQSFIAQNWNSHANLRGNLNSCRPDLCCLSSFFGDINCFTLSKVLSIFLSVRYICEQFIFHMLYSGNLSQIDESNSGYFLLLLINLQTSNV
jgi:hypothetical protein